MNEAKVAKAVYHFCKNHATLILTVLSSVGVAATSVCVASATIKAKEKVDDMKEERENWKETSGIDQPEITKEEIVKECWKFYIPSAVIGVGTISCIIAANAIGAKEQKSLAAAYAMIDQGYKQYRKKVVDRYGKEVDRSIENEVIVEQANADDEDTSKKVTCYDMYSDRYFETTQIQIEKAINAVNRDLAIYGYASLNDFYRKLGVSETEEGDSLGWDIESIAEWLGFCWLDFALEPCNMGNGEKCYVIQATYSPSIDFLR